MRYDYASYLLFCDVCLIGIIKRLSSQCIHFHIRPTNPIHVWIGHVMGNSEWFYFYLEVIEKGKAPFRQ